MMGYRKGAGKVKSTGGAHVAYVYIHHVFALPRAEGRGQWANGRGPKIQGKLLYIVHSPVDQLDYPAASTLGEN